MRLISLKPLLKKSSACLVLLLSGCLDTTDDSDPYIYWSDADSGYIKNIKEDLHFRLYNVDAPETRSMKSRGGAKCEREIELGFLAKEFAVNTARGASFEVSAFHGVDHYDRTLIDLSINGEDFTGLLIDSGHGRHWDYDAGDSKPDWCAKK